MVGGTSEVIYVLQRSKLKSEEAELFHHSLVFFLEYKYIM